MKLKEGKHNHSLTNIIKAALFSLILFLPIMNIAVRCGYVMLNKNAYQSYYGETINETITNSISNESDFVINDNYKYLSVNYTPLFQNNTNEYITISNMKNCYSNDNTINTNLNTHKDNVKYIYVVNSGTNNGYLRFNDTNNTTLMNIAVQFATISFEFTLEGKSNIQSDFLSLIQTIEYNKYSFLDNAFEYSIDKLTETPIYNWTLNTGIYTGIAAMTTGMGITATVIPMLITYWLFITVIYVILDIVIQMFVWLTHLLQEKS